MTFRGLTSPFLSLLLHSAACAAVDVPGSSPMVSKIMRPGMVFKDFVYQLHSRDGENVQTLVAAKAEIRDPSHLMWIDGLAFHGGVGNHAYSVTAPEAIYDFRTGSLQTQREFQGTAFGMRFDGSQLQGDVKSRIFGISGDYEIHLSSPLGAVPPARPETWEQLTGISRISSPTRGHFSIPGVTPIGIVQDFAGDLMTFLQCWSRVAEDRSRSQMEVRRVSELMIMGREGGRIDLGEFAMDLEGRTAILGPRSFLFSHGGIHIGEAEVELDRMMRMNGGGGIQAWMAPSEAGKTLICSEKFEFVSDRRILQFEGGPLTLSRGGIILQASESWQFVRVFDGGRVVLSPGNWKTLGYLAASPN